MLHNPCGLNWFAYRRCLREFKAVTKSQRQSSQGRCHYHPDFWLCMALPRHSSPGGPQLFWVQGSGQHYPEQLPSKHTASCQQRGCMSGGVNEVLRAGKSSVRSDLWKISKWDWMGLTASKGSHLELTWESAKRGEPSCSLERVHGKSIHLLFLMYMGRSNRTGQTDWTMYAMTKKI